MCECAASADLTWSALQARTGGLIANLPDGTAFTVKVQVKDGSGKVWEVPDTAFTRVR